MSLALLSAGYDYKVPHLPKEDLKIRMGINSGPVTTGIIGNKMPKYIINSTVKIVFILFFYRPNLDTVCLVIQ